MYPHREKLVFIIWDPCNENRFFPVGKKYTGKSLFWPCTDPVRDCSEVMQSDYCKLRNRSMSLLVAPSRIYRLLMRGKLKFKY